MLRKKLSAVTIAVLTGVAIIGAPVVEPGISAPVYANAEQPLVMEQSEFTMDHYWTIHTDRSGYKETEPDENGNRVYVDDNCDSVLVDAYSKNERIVRASIEDSYSDYVELTPIGIGTTTVTVTDQNGCTADIIVSVTRGALDDYRYGRLALNAVIDMGSIRYGEKGIYLGEYTDEWPALAGDEFTAYIQVGNQKYYTKSEVSEYYDGTVWIIDLPEMSAGTKYTYYVQLRSAPALTGEGMVAPITLADPYGYASNVKNRTYNGKAQRPSLTVWDEALEDDDLYKPLIAGTDYRVSFTNNKNVGTAKYVVTGINNFKGTFSGTFKIVPKGTSISSLSSGKKSFTAKWKKQATQTTGYQLQYSTSSKFSKAKTQTVTSNKTTKKAVKKLKAKKKYYVRVRTYKKVSGKKYYSAWSKTKTVRTK